MKRYFLLTSVLALAACGGGSGGGAPNGSVARAAVSPDAITSNKDITQMSSEILVAKGSDPITRSATTTYGGKTYTSYRLDDVKFFTAENLNEEDPDKRSFLRLELDRTGQINAIHMDLGGESSGRTVRSVDDPTVFEGPIFEYVKNGDDEAIYRVVDNGQTWDNLVSLASSNHLTGGHWNRIDERLAIKTYGANIDGSGTRLQYSDFGYFNPVYRIKSKKIDAATLGHIRDYEAALDAGHTDEANEIKTTYLSRKEAVLDENGDPELDGNGDPLYDDLDSYRSDSEFAAELAKEDYQLFAGGYAIKTDGTKVDTLTPKKGDSFSGKAVGRVYSSIQADGPGRTTYLNKYGVKYNSTNPSDANYLDPEDPNFIKPEDAGHDVSKAYVTTNATLEIDNEGNQLLTMPFSDDGFYDVTVEKNVGSDAVIIFDDTTAPAVDAVNGSMYRRDADLTTAPGGTNTKTIESFNPGFYGIDDPTEAAGTLQYKEVTNFGSGNKREWEFQAAYGMTKD